MNMAFIILAYWSLFAFGILDNARGPSYPVILQDLNLSPSVGAWFFSLSSLSGLLVTFTAKWWLKLGPLRTTRYFLFFMGLSAIGFAFCTNFSNSVTFLFFSSFLFGLSSSGSGITMNSLVIAGAPIEKRRQIFSGLHSMYGLSSLCAPFLFKHVMHMGKDWSFFFLILSIAPLSGFLLALNLGRIKKSVEPETKVIPMDLYQWLFVLLMMTYVISEVIISSRLVLYLSTSKGMQLGQASEYLFYFFILLFLGRLLFGVLKISIKSDYLLYLSCFLSFIALYIGHKVHPMGYVLCGLSMSYFFPIAIDWISQIFGNSTDIVVSRVMTGVGIGLFGAHAVFGQINDRFGIEVAFLIPVISSIVCFALLSTISYKRIVLEKNQN